MTHPDEDHIGNADTIIEKYKVGTVLYPDISDSGLSFSLAMRACSETGTPTSVISMGDVYQNGDLEIRVIWPSSGTKDDANDFSLVLLVKFGNIRVYYAGDTGTVSEKMIIDEWGDFLKDVDILKVAHHGSHSSTCRSFTDLLSPSASVISCGLNNSFGHPSAEVTERLKNAGSEILRTDISGSIVFFSDGCVIYEK